MNLPKTGSILRRLLIIIPVVVGLTLVSLFMPAQRLSIEGIGLLSFETTVTFSIGYEVAHASPDVATNSPTANTGSAWTNPTMAYDDGGTGYANITSGNPSGSNMWENYGFSLTGETITQVRVRYDAWSAGAIPIVSNNPTANTNGTNPWTNPANGYTSNNSYATAVATIPTYRSTGTVASGTTGAITPALPGTKSANDIFILVASTIAGGSINITANGSVTTWTAISGSPIDVTSGEKLYVWWGRYSSGSTGPTLTPGGDHCIARIVGYYNCYAGGSPIDVSATGTETASDTTFSFATGLTSTYNNELALCACSTGADSTSSQFSTMANTSLASLGERMDNCTSNGGGGGFALAQGTKITAGTLGTWTSTLTTASPKAYISFALLPTVPNNTFDQIYGTFGFSGSGTITKVELGYEAYSSVAEQLDLYTSSNGGSSWNAIHTTANLGTSDPNSYTYIDVTSDTTWTWTLLNDTNFKCKVVTHWLSGTPTWSLDALVVRVTSSTEYDDQIKVDVSWDGGTSWSSTQNTTLTSSETTYWYDVTSATTWTPTTLDDTNLKVRALAQLVGTAEVVNLDWLPVEVNYTTGACAEDISNTPSTWSVNSGSPVVENSNYATGLDYFSVTNNSGGPVNISISGTDMTGGGYTWTLADDGNPGDMIYALKAGLNGGDYTIIVKKTGPYNNLVANLADGNSQLWGLKLYTPTTQANENNLKTGTVTITAVCS